ncbi:hypothetical protein M1N58_00360 [Dehalococcoidales bacterium]|nr:hypothetical protein [Dehalococcoidales bacterium]
MPLPFSPASERQVKASATNLLTVHKRWYINCGVIGGVSAFGFTINPVKFLVRVYLVPGYHQN